MWLDSVSFQPIINLNLPILCIIEITLRKELIQVFIPFKNVEAQYEERSAEKEMFKGKQQKKHFHFFADLQIVVKCFLMTCSITKKVSSLDKKINFFIILKKKISSNIYLKGLMFNIYFSNNNCSIILYQFCVQLFSNNPLIILSLLIQQNNKF